MKTMHPNSLDHTKTKHEANTMFTRVPLSLSLSLALGPSRAKWNQTEKHIKRSKITAC